MAWQVRETPLHLAIYKGSYEVAKILVTRGADTQMKNTVRGTEGGTETARAGCAPWTLRPVDPISEHMHRPYATVHTSHNRPPVLACQSPILSAVCRWPPIIAPTTGGCAPPRPLHPAALAAPCCPQHGKTAGDMCKTTYERLKKIDPTDPEYVKKNDYFACLKLLLPKVAEAEEAAIMKANQPREVAEAAYQEKQAEARRESNPFGPGS